MFLSFANIKTIRLSNSNLIRQKLDIFALAKILRNRYENKWENKCTKILTKILTKIFKYRNIENNR
jgi:hypothetical protein